MGGHLGRDSEGIPAWCVELGAPWLWGKGNDGLEPNHVGGSSTGVESHPTRQEDAPKCSPSFPLRVLPQRKGTCFGPEAVVPLPFVNPSAHCMPAQSAASS